MCHIQIYFQFWFWMGAKNFCLSQFSCEKRQCFAPIRSWPGYYGWCDYRTINAFLLPRYFFTKSLTMLQYITYQCPTYVSIYILENMVTMAPLPPHPKSAQHTMRTWKAFTKKRRIAGVSAHWFNARTNKKARVIAIKPHLYSASTLVVGLQNNSQKNKGTVSLKQKNALPCCKY
jgi:hypothetical protein